MTTHTIAYDTESGMLLAVCRDDSAIADRISEFARQTEVEIDMSRVTIERGLTLTDDDDSGEVVFTTGNHAGGLEDDEGRSYKYAVR